MKLVCASIFAAAISAKSIIDLKPYNPDSRPTDVKTVEPASWVEEIQANIGQDCEANPYILNFLISKLPSSQTKMERKTVWSSLRKCKNNDAVKHVMTIEYLMKKKPELYNSLLTVGDGKSKLDHNGDGTNDYVIDFLQLDGKKSFRDNLSGWSKSKIAINFMKWKYYNDLFNTMSLQKFQFWTRKANDLKLHKADAEKKYTNKLEQIRDYKPFLKPFMRKQIAPAAPVAPVAPVQPIQQVQPVLIQSAQPIIPVEPMPVAVSVEEKAEEEKVETTEE